MKVSTSIALALVFLFQLASAAVATLQSPDNDPFYVQPANVSDYAPGEIIRWRVAPAPLRALVYRENVKNHWQFLLRSTNNHGEATAVVTTIIEPYDSDPLKLLSYQYAQDSVALKCAISYNILYGANILDGLEIQLETYLLSTALSRGWFVVAPDYEGLTSSWIAGPNSGHSTLDSIRAALASTSTTGIQSDAQVVMWGYSGGTVASGWAAALQPAYAPDLKDNLIGVALGGWVTNFTLTAEVTDGTLFAGFIPLAIEGLLSQYPEKQSLLQTLTTPWGYATFNAIKTLCVVPAILSFLFQNVFSGPVPLITEGWAFFQRDDIKGIVSNNTLAIDKSQGVPDIPVFVFHGSQDEIVPIAGAERVYEDWCSWGINSFEFAVSSTSGHIVEAVEGSGAALAWINARFNGEQPVSGCTRTVRATNLDYPGVDNTYYWVVKTIEGTLFGEDIGTSYNRNATISALADQVFDFVKGLLAAIGPIPLKKRELTWLPTEEQLVKRDDQRSDLVLFQRFLNYIAVF